MPCSAACLVLASLRDHGRQRLGPLVDQLQIRSLVTEAAAVMRLNQLGYIVHIALHGSFADHYRQRGIIDLESLDDDAVRCAAAVHGWGTDG